MTVIALVRAALPVRRLSNTALIPIWGLIARSVMHMVIAYLVGCAGDRVRHFFLVMTIISFAQACNTPPGSPPPSSNYKSNDLPPRAYFLQREQTIILGFDHYCWWLGAPIGWYNRKFFLQFVIYASSLAGYSFVFITMDTFRLLPGDWWRPARSHSPKVRGSECAFGTSMGMEQSTSGPSGEFNVSCPRHRASTVGRCSTAAMLTRQSCQRIRRGTSTWSSKP